MPLLRLLRRWGVPALWSSLPTGTLASETQAPEGGGSGRSLPIPLLVVSTLAATFATLFSFFLIWKQLKNYRKPTLQRYVVRLLVMVPIYSIASVISLYSLELADIIDLIRDLYEAFVIYCFFNLLIEYLGGERSLIILLHGRTPQEHLFPVNLFLHDMDASDPYTFLALKRGVLQYVQIKPVLAIATLLLKSVGKYEDGKISPSNGYTWVSFTYNVSVFVSLYCLAMFWKCLNEDLKPFRVTSKFLCIKGIIFFSFWQGLGISILVAAGIVKTVGPVYDPEYISLAIQDFMICLEMPIFALAHAYAFSHKDYIDPFAHYAARLPVYYALRDCIGMYDVFSDSLTTVRGTGYVYQTFEPSEGVIHQPLARERRSKAGLRYTQGGKGKYWLPQRGTGDVRGATPGARHQGPMKKLRTYIDNKRMQIEGHAPLTQDEADEVVHIDPDLQQADNERSPLIKRPKDAARTAMRHAGQGLDFFAQRGLDSDDEAESLTFEPPTSDEEDAYHRSRSLHFGDYAYPNIDVQREQSRQTRWREDEEIVHRRKRKKSLTSGSDPVKGVATDANIKDATPSSRKSKDKGKGKSPTSTKIARGNRNGKAKDTGEHGELSGSQSKRARKSPWLAWDADTQAGPDQGHEDQPVEADSRNGAEQSDVGDEDKKGNGVKGPAEEKKEEEEEEEEEEEQEGDPYGAVDLVVEDFKAEERERLLERRRGDPALRAGKGARIFRKQYQPSPNGSGTTSPVAEFPFSSGTKMASNGLENETSKAKERREEPEAPSTAKAAVEAKTTTPGGGSTSAMPAEVESGVPAVQKAIDREPEQHLTDQQPLSRQIETRDNKDFLEGRVLSPASNQYGHANDDSDHNPWS
ncbi:DUF300-domain-containing protein [Testicularia cyperi]|uniref:DUF300-domain-containing protein n=1 Tax=Testicularia cyperi TaxID=1882483 RepID=A0A317XKA4_9BASI|nr:DUF300-domain-containing protein [Testicularia cyperi]